MLYVLCMSTSIIPIGYAVEWLVYLHRPGSVICLSHLLGPVAATKHGKPLYFVRQPCFFQTKKEGENEIKPLRLRAAALLAAEEPEVGMSTLLPATALMLQRACRGRSFRTRFHR